MAVEKLTARLEVETDRRVKKEKKRRIYAEMAKIRRYKQAHARSMDSAGSAAS